MIDKNKITIGAYATYCDTGIWSMRDGAVVAPDDLTIAQLKDFLLASGGRCLPAQRWEVSLDQILNHQGDEPWAHCREQHSGR